MKNNIERYKQSLKTNMKRSWLVLAAGFIFSLFVLGGVYIIGTIRKIPLGVITRDPATTTNNYFIGMLSNTGIMLWAATAAICFLGAILLVKAPRTSRFLLASGLLTTLLALDDALCLHDEIIPALLHIHEWPIYVGYLLLIVVYIGFFLRYILSETAYPILALAFFFFGLSILMDVFFDSFPTLDLQPFFEDGFKFIGITLWLSYFFLTVVLLTKPKINLAQSA